ncbi:EAL domain-containing protein [Pseudoduganella sp. LjRoot289]|uniref:bifunctional diguanylate cyclase/phosphodiesterase n=1 Tax=Pseudoduganella sp. LjRoot289 TaxID=3342314 RepID=UPI003ECF11DC
MSRVPPHPDSVAEALQLIGLPACACASDGSVLASNPELDELLGFVSAGRPMADVFARHARADSAARLEEALADAAAGPPSRWDSCLARADGQYIPVQATLKPLPGGAATGAVIVFHDISGFQRDQRALRKTLLEQKAILENAAVGIIFGKGGYVFECNIRAADMFGYARSELEGTHGRMLYANEDVQRRVIEESSPLLSQGQSFKSEAQLRRKDGVLFWGRIYGRAIDPSDAAEGTVWIVEDISEQKAAEEATRQLLLEQNAILDNASVGILFTKSQTLLNCNPRLAEMFGYTREDLYGRPSVEVFTSPEAYAEFGREASPLLGSGLPFEKKEFEFKRKDGSLLWCHVRAQAVSHDVRDGGTIWIMEDITRSRQTQMEVEAIMTNASISILFTKNRVITRYNRGFAEMFRYQGDEGLGLPGASLYPSQAAYERLGAAASPFLLVGKPFQTEVEMRRKDDSTFWAQLIAYVVNPDDTTQGTIWIVEDRTEQKLAEGSLRNALLENQAILDSAVLGISVCEGGCNLRCNSKMEELFGYAPGEMNGLSVQAFYADLEAWDAARKETARDFHAGLVNTSEYQLVRKDGSRFWARLSGRPFDLAQPNGRSVWLVDDITERRADAEAVRQARDELEVRVLERTAELAGANAMLQGEIVERRQAEARVHHMAYHDSLTGLPNRALLADRLDRAMLAAQRSNRRLAVMFLDLDRFKTINDSLGHMTGDQLLKEVASRLCRAVRASDTVARLGGDEFVVLVPGIRSIEEASRVAEKIIESLAVPFPLEGRTLHITPSIGICVFPDDGEDVETLMRHADGAMYHAKASGRNNYQFFTQKMNVAAAQHFELENSLRSALALGQFEPHFQPIMDIATRRVHTMEVLLRWRRPGLGLVMPDCFIPLIEENGLIVPIGEWVMRRACEQSMEWLGMGLQPVPLAVNLSPRQFMHRGLVESIRRILDETGIDPAMLEFEITETALMQHGEHTMEILGQINAMGIRLSIDDFGTGYSSLAYLKRFPVKKIKIDRAFIKDLEESSEDRAIVAAIIALSDSLQMPVVAEGVETEGQFALLQRQGCQYAQGYLFSQPVPRENAQHMLEKRS